MNDTDKPVDSWASDALFDLQQQWKVSQKSASMEKTATPSQDMLDEKVKIEEDHANQDPVLQEALAVAYTAVRDVLTTSFSKKDGQSKSAPHKNGTSRSSATSVEQVPTDLSQCSSLADNEFQTPNTSRDSKSSSKERTDDDGDDLDQSGQISNKSREDSEVVVPVSRATDHCCLAHRAWLPTTMPCQDVSNPIPRSLNKESSDPFVNFDSAPRHADGEGPNSQQSSTTDFADEAAFVAQFREVEGCHASLAAAQGALQNHFRHIGHAPNESGHDEQSESSRSTATESPPRITHGVRKDSPMAHSKQESAPIVPPKNPSRNGLRTIRPPTPGEWLQRRLPLSSSPYGSLPSKPIISPPAAVHISPANSSPPPAMPSPPDKDIGLEQAPITEGDDIQMFDRFPAIHPRHPGRLNKERFPLSPSATPMPPQPSARDLESIGHIQVIQGSPPPEEEEQAKKPLRNRLLPWLLVTLAWVVGVTICCAILGHNHHRATIPSLLGHTDKSSEAPVNSFFHSMDFRYDIRWPAGFPALTSAYEALALNATLSPAREEFGKTVFANETGQAYTEVNDPPKPWAYDLPPGSVSNLTLYHNSSSNSTGLYVALRCTANYTQDLIALQATYPSLFEAARTASAAATDTSDHRSNGINILSNILTILCFLPFWLLLSGLPQLVRKPEKKHQHCCRYERACKKLGWVGTWVAVVVASIFAGALLGWGLGALVGWVAERS